MLRRLRQGDYELEDTLDYYFETSLNYIANSSLKTVQKRKQRVGRRSEEQLLLYLSLFPNTHTGRLISVSPSHWNPFTVGTASSYEECRSDLQTYTFKGPVLCPFKGEF